MGDTDDNDADSSKQCFPRLLERSASMNQNISCFPSCWRCQPDNAVSCFRKPCIYGSTICKDRSVLLLSTAENENEGATEGKMETFPTIETSSWTATIATAVKMVSENIIHWFCLMVSFIQELCHGLLDFTVDYLTPGRNPLLWVLINASVVVYSLALLVLEAYYAEDESKWALRLANQSYLVYDFSTTIIWVLETILGAVCVMDTTSTSRARRASHSSPKNGAHNSMHAAISNDETWRFSLPASVLHVIIALFFLMDSFTTLLTWKWKKEDIVVDAMWVAINLAAYTLVLLETLFHVYMSRRRRQRRQHYADILYDETPIAMTLHHDPVLAGMLPIYQQLVVPYVPL